ncbi:MAG: DUF262 domain-containing HNH endonuclease family protein [Methylicorpusculum sp.]|uniref:DUF262 domain-containing protein n=1 Tax=Methylicorpusculum sp. TaxID=2713644 RepID=UPI002730C3BA|nr:DUF262 domain-containing HNH endonuclease family protein [Methylicorpusculum sp.]MDP2203750.1 DUF262 domain-containing HNH endonuclease family protein [Methylicorpusculum sp.]
MSKKISGAEYPIAKIFSSDFDYIIPSYQRPYAWTVDQASELFDDLYDFFLREVEDTYFLGSIVLIKDEGKPAAEVIDGQQRLTTLTILLSSLGHLAPGTYKESLKKYICEPGDEIEQLAPRPRICLRERDKAFFADYVQSMQFDELLSFDPAQLANESQRNIQANAKLLLNRIQNAVAIDTDFIKRFASFLVLRCFLVVVSTPSQQSAFRVFSVLNSRGLDLLPTDIIKSNVIGNIPPAKQEEFTDKWEELEVETTRNGFAELFGHIRMIYAKAKAKRTLLEEFKEHVLPVASSAVDLVTNVIEPYAEAYLVAKNCQYVSTTNAADINSLLKWLNRIDNSDWLPPAIMFLAQKKNEPDYVFWFFKKLERLAAYMHICGKNVNDRVQRYALVLDALQKKPHSLQAPIDAIELTVDEKAEMKAALNGKIYWLTARRRNYLILRLDAFLSDAAATYDPSILTIEHVLPQTVSPDSEWAITWPDQLVRGEWVHRIANLIPLTQKRNSKAQNYDFSKKKTAYFGGKQGISSYILTTQVLNTDEWSPDTVKIRQESLLGVMADKWELLNP